MIERLVFVGLGGALGAMARYGLGRMMPASAFPWPTFVANSLGGLLMGLLVGWLSLKAAEGGETLRLLLGVGLLGGFTTFSAFSLETVQMIERRDWALAMGYVAGSVVVSVAALMLGLMIARKVFA
jgi:crcB protein